MARKFEELRSRTFEIIARIPEGDVRIKQFQEGSSP